VPTRFDMTGMSGSNTSTHTVPFIALLVWNDRFEIIRSNFQTSDSA